MNDGMSVWQQTILRQNEELEKLRGFVADYEGTLVEMRSAIREAALLRQQLQDAITLSHRYRAALSFVQASCPVTPCQLPGDNFLSSELLAHVAHVLDEYPGWLDA